MISEEESISKFYARRQKLLKKKTKSKIKSKIKSKYLNQFVHLKKKL